MMCPIHCKALKLAVQEARSDHGNVGQMGASEERIVEQDGIAITPVESIHQVLHGVRHAAQMHRDVCRLRNQPAAAIENRAGEIQAVPDVGRERGTAQGCAHLLAQRLHTA